MKYIIEQIQEQKSFDAFVNENMKTSTYQVGWDREMDVEYEPSKAFQAYTAEFAAAMLGSVIAPGAERPKHDMPSIGEITGTIARMGDEWQISNERLERYFYMENRFREKAKNFTQEQKGTQYARIVKYLFNPYETAAIAPHRRILAQYWEGLSDGQYMLDKKNNKGGIVWSLPIPNGIAKHKLRKTDIVWSKDNLKTMDIIAAIEYLEEIADAKGRTIQKLRVSKRTAALITQAEQFKNLLGLSLGKIKTATTPAMGIDLVNEYLTGVNKPTFEVINDVGILATGEPISMFKDGRVVAQCIDRPAVLKVADPLETIDPVPNKVYTSFNDNLISQWRDTNGRYVAYEMFGYPVFTGKDDVFILDVTAKDEE